MRFQWPRAVVIDGPDAIAGYAPELELNYEVPHVVSWQEGGHRRAFEVGKVLQDDAHAYRFEDTRGRQYTLRPMTLELYESHVRRHTLGRPAFGSMGALLEAMEREW